MEIVLEKLSNDIIACGIEVHRIIGPGVYENVYKKCLEYELKAKGLKVRSEVALPLVYKSINFDCSYRIDLLVEDQIILELKAISEITKIHKAQLLTYLKLANKRVGFIFNFNNSYFTEGISKIINNMKQRN